MVKCYVRNEKERQTNRDWEKHKVYILCLCIFFRLAVLPQNVPQPVMVRDLWGCHCVHITLSTQRRHRCRHRTFCERARSTVQFVSKYASLCGVRFFVCCLRIVVVYRMLLATAATGGATPAKTCKCKTRSQTAREQCSRAGSLYGA